MIPTREQAIGAAQKWQGYRDDAGAKVWAAYAPVDYTGSSYCGAGQGMLCKQLGLDTAPTTHERIIFVPWVVDDARKAGKWILSKDSHPGDWVIFSWGNGYHDIPSSNADHIGMIVANDPTKPTVTTFEFNTTDGTGTGVRGAFLRTRSRDDIMGCVDRQGIYAPDPPPKPAQLDVDGFMGQKTVNRWAAVMGTHTGRHDLIVAVQTYLNRIGCRDENGNKLAVDGVCDLDNTAHATTKQHTTAAVQRHLGTTIDGVWSHPSSGVQALQRALNAAKTGSKEF